MLLKKNYVNCLKSVETFMGFWLRKEVKKQYKNVKVKIHQGVLHVLIEKIGQLKLCENMYIKAFSC